MSDDTETKTEAPAPKADKPKKPTKADAAALKISELEAKVDLLESKIKIITAGFEFAGDQVRPLYGMGALALVFDAIYKKLV